MQLQRIFLGLAMALAAISPNRIQAQACCGGIVFVADGAGNSSDASRDLKRVIRQDCLPLEVIRFSWSHGHLRAVADQTDLCYLQEQGRRFACEILAFHQQNPQTPIYVLGHSAGAMVVLVALENLPAGVVDRAFLLNPSMSSCYDIRCALRNVKCGLHNYYSKCDVLILGVGTCLVGNADGGGGKTAGRVGFNAPCDPEPASKLFQQPWSKADVWLGHNGGHYGAHAPHYLRRYVVPFMR